MSINKILFSFILLLSFFLRFYDLKNIPTGFYTDEAAFGYNAYSLLKTSNDEFGNKFPLVFRSFGDYKSPLFFYYLIPFVGVFDLSVVSVRLGSVVLGLGIVLGIYILTYLLTRSVRISLFSMVAASVMPFSLQFNRMVHENNLSVCLILYGFIFFLIRKKNSFMLVISGILFGLSIFAYHDAKIITPLFLGGLLFLFRKRYPLSIKEIVLFFTPLILLIGIFFLNSVNSSGLHRPLTVLVFNDQGTIADIIGWRQDISFYRNPDISRSAKLFINKPVNFMFIFLEHYLSHYTSSYLFFFGDPVKIYSTIGSGVLLISFLPVLLIGLISLFTHAKKNKELVIWMLIIAPLPGALTQYVPTASRTYFLIVPFCIILGLGFLRIGSFIKNKRYAFPIFLISCMVFIFEFSRFLTLYFFVTPVRLAKDWNYGREELMQTVKKYEPEYKHIWFTRQVGEYIYPLFFNKIDPLQFQNQHTWHETDNYGFQWVKSFGKYTFDTMPPRPWVNSNTLYIGLPENFDSEVTPLYVLKYPTGNPAYYILDYRSFKVPYEL